MDKKRYCVLVEIIARSIERMTGIKISRLIIRHLIKKFLKELLKEGFKIEDEKKEE